MASTKMLPPTSSWIEEVVLPEIIKGLNKMCREEGGGPGDEDLVLSRGVDRNAPTARSNAERIIYQFWLKDPDTNVEDDYLLVLHLKEGTVYASNGYYRVSPVYNLQLKETKR